MINEENLEPKLVDLINQNNFNENTYFYRYTSAEFLTPSGTDNEFLITSNPNPTESVINIYKDGHIWAAKDIGAGLAFTESIDDEWKSDDKICVKILLSDILEQGGMIYSVESVIIAKTWYFTLPSGKVKVCKA